MWGEKNKKGPEKMSTDVILGYSLLAITTFRSLAWDHYERFSPSKTFDTPQYLTL